ncbi:MAG TPA: hypothetical protein VN687_15065 [Blastocatellia bacterium]|nr:hypothetical protein [Blastocatellia bacterium]
MSKLSDGLAPDQPNCKNVITNPMKLASWSLLITATLSALAACSAAPGRSTDYSYASHKSANPLTIQAAGARVQNSGKVVHVLVALCDNEHQGIVPVPARLGNGEDLTSNLYWGAAYGVKAFFAKSTDWKLIEQTQNPAPAVLERCIFKNKSGGVYLVADAYRGAEIKKTITDFFDYASGGRVEVIDADSSKHPAINAGGAADLIVFIGHNGLMNFKLESYPTQQNNGRRGAIILCCASKSYFSAPLRRAGADPILWTNGLMAPEAYVLNAGLDGWIANESGEQIRNRAAKAYNAYQHCGLKAARGLFAGGW